MDVRAADASEIDQLARVWFDSWRDAHAAIVPGELTRLRTLDSFRQRLLAYLSDYGKLVDGPLAICELGLTKLRAECPHLDAWLRGLEE